MIKLTRHDGNTIFLNANHVVYVQKDTFKKTTFIKLSTGGIYVKEEVHRVLSKLEIQLRPRDSK